MVGPSSGRIVNNPGISRLLRAMCTTTRVKLPSKPRSAFNGELIIARTRANERSYVRALAKKRAGGEETEQEEEEKEEEEDAAEVRRV